MAKASDNEFPSVLFEEQASTPATPASGFGRLFIKSDGVYFVDDAGTETGPFGSGGGGGTTIESAGTTLTNHTPNNTSMEQWGTEEATVAQADAPSSAVVVAWLTGNAETSTASDDRGRYGMEVSFDGGSTWADLGSPSPNYNHVMPPGESSGGRFAALAVTGRATGTVTGDVMVRAICADIDTANTCTFHNGYITVLVHG